MKRAAIAAFVTLLFAVFAAAPTALAGATSEPSGGGGGGGGGSIPVPPQPPTFDPSLNGHISWPFEAYWYGSQSAWNKSTYSYANFTIPGVRVFTSDIQFRLDWMDKSIFYFDLTLRGLVISTEDWTAAYAAGCYDREQGSNFSTLSGQFDASACYQFADGTSYASLSASVRPSELDYLKVGSQEYICGMGSIDGGVWWEWTERQISLNGRGHFLPVGNLTAQEVGAMFATPEPATLCLLAAGGLASLVSRRR